MSPMRPGRLARPVLVAGLMVGLAGAPAAAVADIPEDEVISTPGRQLIHVRIQRGCEDAAVDRVEVRIPNGVYGVLPGAVGDWVAETEVSETEEYEVFGQTRTDRVSLIRWTGGPLPADQFLDFPIYAVFSETDPELAIPVVQGCGLVEEEWTEVPDEDQDRDDLDFPAPTVAVVAPPTTDLATLEAVVEELRGELEQVRTELGELPDGGVAPVPDEALEPLRERIRNLRQRINGLEERLEAIEGRQQEAEGDGEG
jgi:periplasmic copper chaperone A